jgi:hypothetical protein
VIDDTALSNARSRLKSIQSRSGSRVFIERRATMATTFKTAARAYTHFPPPPWHAAIKISHILAEFAKRFRRRF